MGWSSNPATNFEYLDQLGILHGWPSLFPQARQERPLLITCYEAAAAAALAEMAGADRLSPAPYGPRSAAPVNLGPNSKLYAPSSRVTL